MERWQIDGDRSALLGRSQPAHLTTKCESLFVLDAPDGAGGVVGDHQGAIAGDSYSYRAAPNLAIGRDEPCHEVLILPGRRAIFQWNANHFIAGPFGSIPGSVLGGESV